MYFMMNERSVFAFAGALVALVGAREAAAANPDCGALPTPVYVTGSSAVKPLLQELGKKLATASAPVTIVYQGQGSCTGVNAVLSGTLMTGTDSSPAAFDKKSARDDTSPIWGPLHNSQLTKLLMDDGLRRSPERRDLRAHPRAVGARRHWRRTIDDIASEIA